MNRHVHIANFDDPYRLYDAFHAYGPYRAESPGEPLWILSRHSDVASALLDERLSSAPQGTARQITSRATATVGSVLLRKILSRQIEVMNGPAHRRLRNVVAAAVAQLSPDWLVNLIEQRVAERFESVRGDATFDFVARIAAPLPREILLDVLGLAPDERELFAGAVQIMLASLRSSEPDGVEIAAGEDAAASIVAMAADWRDRKSTDVDAPLIDRLVSAADDDLAMTTEELAANVILLFAAGHGTTTSLLGNAVYLRLQGIEASPVAAARPTDRSRFIEEVLRFESPIQSVRRTAVTSLVVGASRIETCDEVLLILGAANRDPTRFEGAEAFDPARTHPSHLAFGLGAHKCPGARMARLQAEAVLAAIDESVDGLRCVSPQSDWLSSANTRGLRSLNLRWVRDECRDRSITVHRRTTG